MQVVLYTGGLMQVVFIHIQVVLCRWSYTGGLIQVVFIHIQVVLCRWSLYTGDLYTYTGDLI